MRNTIIMKALVLAAAAVLAGCGARSDSSQAETSPAAETSASTETEAPAETAAPDENTDQPAESAEPLVQKVYEYDPEKPVIALTFDDGPNTTNTPKLLDKLEQYDIPASFFLIGQNINDDNAEYVRRAYTMGCDIENHSLTHSQQMGNMDDEKLHEEIDKTEELIKGVLGDSWGGSQFFRPPYNIATSTMYSAIDMAFVMGYGCDDWDASVSTETRVEKTLEQAGDGVIILLHDQPENQSTVDALDEIIPALKEQGYQFVTISQLFEAKHLDPTDELYARYRVINVVEEMDK